MADTMEVICSTENGTGSWDLVESPSLGCSLLLLSSLMLRTGGGCSVCDKPESSFERFKRVAGELPVVSRVFSPLLIPRFYRCHGRLRDDL